MICPFMSSVYTDINMNKMFFQDCCEKDCALWVAETKLNEKLHSVLTGNGNCGLLSKE